MGYTLGSEGDIAAAAYSTWDEGTGLSSGLFTSGTVWSLLRQFHRLVASPSLALQGSAAGVAAVTDEAIPNFDHESLGAGRYFPVE